MSKDANRNRDTNPDPITGAPGSHPVSTGVGAAAAGAAGAALGSIVPGVGTAIGGAVGAVVGAVSGGLAGKAAGEAIDPTGDDEYWRKRHETSDVVQKGTEFDHYKPAYQYGSSLARHPGSMTEYDDTTVAAGWEQNRGETNLSYEEARPAIRDAYEHTLQLREEQLRIEKERVQTGEVAVRREVTTEMETVEVPVEREEVVIEHRAVGAGARGAAGEIGSDEIRIPVSEERVNVSKDTVVTGEVAIGKRKVTDTQTVSEEVRKEHARVDREGSTRIDERK